MNVACVPGPQWLPAPNVVSAKYIFGGLTVSPVRDLNNPELLSEGSYSPFLSSRLGT